MKIHYILVGLFAIILLAVSSYGLASSDHRLVLDDDDIADFRILKRDANESINDTDLNADNTTNTITPISSVTTSGEPNASTTATVTPSTTTDTTATAKLTTTTETSTTRDTIATTNLTTTTETSTTSTTATEPSTTSTTTSEASKTSNATTESSATSPITTVAPETSTTITQSPTTKGPGRQFDGLSFFGGMILAVGLGALIYLVLRYLRRTNRLPYSNLR